VGVVTPEERPQGAGRHSSIEVRNRTTSVIIPPKTKTDQSRRIFDLIFSNNSELIAPYGGKLVDLIVPAESFDDFKAYASQLPSIQISPRSVCDLELLATGAFSPLDRFMGRGDYQCVLDEMRLADGTFFPIPVILPVEVNPDLRLDRDIALRNSEYELLAVLTIDDIYQWDRIELADKVYGTRDLNHPVLAELHRWGPLNISGRLKIMQLPGHFDFQDLRLTPSQMRSRLAGLGRRNVVAHQPPSALPGMDERLIEKALDEVDGILLLHLAVGLARLGDIDHYTRVRLYKALAERYPQPGRVLLSLLPLANHLTGPRDPLWQALICRNYGANHVLVSRNHAGPRISGDHRDGAHGLVEKYIQELGVEMVADQGQSAQEGTSTASIFTTPAVSKVPNNGRSVAGWTIQREVAQILAEAYPPRHQQGVCIWFTGLSGAGKSTTAQLLTWLLLEHGRKVAVLDGDVVRTHLSKGLGFSKEDRDTNVRRIGFVASELVRLGGVVICAVVSPYRAARNDVRNMVGIDQFVEVFVDTPLEVCEARDVKGMYAKARRGALKGFTGIDDPYEPPDHPEITLDTVNQTPQENARFILEYLIEQGFIGVGQNHNQEQPSRVN
jgi:sulfate adenylyltransferase